MLIPEFATIRRDPNGSWMLEHETGYIPEVYAGPHSSREAAKEAFTEWAIKYHVILAIADALALAGAEDMIVDALGDAAIELEDAVVVLRENHRDTAADFCQDGIYEAA